MGVKRCGADAKGRAITRFEIVPSSIRQKLHLFAVMREMELSTRPKAADDHDPVPIVRSCSANDFRIGKLFHASASRAEMLRASSAG